MDVLNATNDLLPLLPEVQDALSEDFDGVECSMGAGVVLAQAPFRMTFAHMGRQVTFVPDTSCLEEFDGAKLHRINLGPKSAVFTDGEPGCCMELILGAGRDWKTPLTKLFTRVYPNKWAFFITELESGQASYHILSSSHGMVSSARREDTPDSTEQSSMVSSPTASVSDATNYSLWIVPVTKVFAIPAPKKVKVIRKVIKKRTPVDGSVNGSVNGNVTPLETTVSNGTVTTNGHSNGNMEDGEKKVRLVKKKPVEKMESSTEREISPLNDIPKAEFAKVSSSDSMKTVVNGKTEKEEAGPSNDSSDGSASELRKKLTEKMMEQKFMVNGEQRPLNGSASSRAIGRSISRSSMTPDRRLDPIFEDGSKQKQSISSAIAANRPTITRNSATPPSTPKTLVSHPSKPNIPVIALQAVLTNCFNYEHLGRLREVHPHWDEIAGQLLNSGYYKLLERFALTQKVSNDLKFFRSDKLLMALQRKVVSEPGLHYATSVLTNIQVHVLNPVDIMRAVIDEGVCCFPYGVILDKTFLLLDRVEAMLHGSYEEDVHWEPVAKLAKKAAAHYRGNLERVMEERMGENLRLKAAQRIIRLESFVVDAQVAKLEKESHKAKEDLRWEIDQLHQKNSQLRKDNREMKANQMRLEARVEALEQKFKTLARLLS
ncbi:Protein CBG12237 [Caenorhabditis briggsae]|uniref:Protein CBG12237 n=1 Tax=Caenorhabditis briggsae TaxID=6238 RepID=A8XEX3_CAEBR|nr:Protein CBG12237 [Caenorhabditis briggsae]CAP31195.2 Protein CBG12237 [Caenorhabditis briggsae]